MIKLTWGWWSWCLQVHLSIVDWDEEIRAILVAPTSDPMLTSALKYVIFEKWNLFLTYLAKIILNVFLVNIMEKWNIFFEHIWSKYFKCFPFEHYFPTLLVQPGLWTLEFECFPFKFSILNIEHYSFTLLVQPGLWILELECFPFQF